MRHIDLIDLINDAKECCESRQVLYDLEEESGVKYFSRRAMFKNMKNVNMCSATNLYIGSATNGLNGEENTTSFITSIQYRDGIYNLEKNYLFSYSGTPSYRRSYCD